MSEHDGLSSAEEQLRAAVRVARILGFAVDYVDPVNVTVEGCCWVGPVASRRGVRWAAWVGRCDDEGREAGGVGVHRSNDVHCVMQEAIAVALRERYWRQAEVPS